jgi:hypothetical protein
MIKQVLLFSGLLVASFSLAAKVKFSTQQLETDFKITHKVLPANLLGLANKQLVLFGENDKKERLLAVYKLEIDCNAEQPEQYSKVLQTVIPQHFLAYDLLKTSDREKLLFQSNNAIFEFVPAEQNFRQIVDSHSIYLRADAQYLASRNFTQDVNGDELDDIVVADFRQVHFYFQTPQATFTHQVLAVEPKISLDEGSATYTETPLYFSDIDQDGKPDLIMVKDGGLEFYRQNGQGTYNHERVSLPLAIDIKAMNWWEIRESDGDSLDQNALSYRTLNEIKDLNNDQIVDLVVRFSQSEGVLERQNNYEVYLGRLVEGKVTYAKEPDSVLKVDGTTIAVKIIDLDGDNRMEVVLLSLDIGVTQIIGALLSGSIDQDVYVFKMDENDKYSDEPEVNKEVELSFSLSSGKSGQPVVQVADFDGDGLKDLMFSDGPEKLKIYHGNNDKRLFDRRSARHKIALPKDGEFVEAQDLNNDGKQDVIIRYGRQDDAALNNKLVILFSS